MKTKAFKEPQNESDIDRIVLTDLVPYIHVIVGDGGRCLCGCYNGKPYSCVDILKYKSNDILAAFIIVSSGAEPTALEQKEGA